MNFTFPPIPAASPVVPSRDPSTRVLHAIDAIPLTLTAWQTALNRLIKARDWFRTHDRTHPRYQAALRQRSQLETAAWRHCLHLERLVADYSAAVNQLPPDQQEAEVLRWLVDPRDRAAWWRAHAPNPHACYAVCQNGSAHRWWPEWAGPLPAREEAP